MAIQNVSVGSGTPTNIYQSSGETAVTTIMFCNIGQVDTSISVWMVPNGVSLSNTAQVLNAVDMPAGETFSIDTERFILADGDSIFAEAADSNAIAVTVSYINT